MAETGKRPITQQEKALRLITVISSAKRPLGRAIGLNRQDFDSQSYANKLEYAYQLLVELQIDIRKEFKL